MQRDSRLARVLSAGAEAIVKSATGYRHGAVRFSCLLVNLLDDFLPCVAPLG